MNPSTWGPSLWTAIHYIALGFPDRPSSADIAKYKAFFTSLGAVLPCFKCSLNYDRHLQELPIDPYMVDADSLFKWTCLLHNIVNKETGKPEMNLQEAYKKYTSQLVAAEEVGVKSVDPRCNLYIMWFMLVLNILTILLILFLLLQYK